MRDKAQIFSLMDFTCVNQYTTLDFCLYYQLGSLQLSYVLALA